MSDDSLIFLFPGQGSQSIGMLANLNAPRQFSETFQEASDHLGYDVWALAQNGPEDTINKTEYTQPLLLTASVALWRWWHTGHHDSIISGLAGHSLGEYSALVCAGSLAFTDALSLVQKRGQLMQEAVPVGEGAMAAIIGLDDNTVVTLCEGAQKQTNHPVSAANFNAPGQVVVAGQTPAVEYLMQTAKEQGAKLVKRLPMTVPSHCELMRSAAQELTHALKKVSIKPPKYPVLHNADVRTHPEPDNIRNALIQQLYSPVRWVECVQWFVTEGHKQFIECGAGKVLTGLNKRISREISTQPLSEAGVLTEV